MASPVERRVTVRLSGELLGKMQNWTGKGISLSDTVRQALALLPNCPEETAYTRPSPTQIKPLQKVEINIQLKAETEYLKALQEW
jgi:Arc/MetJ-type ribon-helix-helix transcriptional regulator